jgi:hypothetical protein
MVTDGSLANNAFKAAVCVAAPVPAVKTSTYSLTGLGAASPVVTHQDNRLTMRLVRNRLRRCRVRDQLGRRRIDVGFSNDPG